MSANLHIGSHEIPYVQMCLKLGIIEARKLAPEVDEWETETIEEIGIRLMNELREASSSGEGYVNNP